ncbi:ABC transporter ATP-binding protein [Streptomyces sp. NPDC057002]|uniref:ABC transporter ATP-binding protein n=1 Tax=Streptomyces sp. NPDC057002 TaxID=3345992 RepID=UPI00362B5C24
MIEVKNLTKRYADKAAVDHLTFTVAPGVVTGFLGPNGAGKSTTMRMILGLDTPTAGTATVAGRPYRELPEPMRALGALLEAKAAHPSRTARHHLACLAVSNGLPVARVDEVLERVGLQGVAGKRAGQFSLGMSQRLGIAGALLGDPEDFVESSSERTVLVRTPSAGSFAEALRGNGATVRAEQDDRLVVGDMESLDISKLAGAHGVLLAELTPQRTSLEDAFMRLTRDSVEYTVAEGAR